MENWTGYSGCCGSCVVICPSFSQLDDLVTVTGHGRRRAEGGEAAVVEGPRMPRRGALRQFATPAPAAAVAAARAWKSASPAAHLIGDVGSLDIRQAGRLDHRARRLRCRLVHPAAIGGLRPVA